MLYGSIFMICPSEHTVPLILLYEKLLALNNTTNPPLFDTYFHPGLSNVRFDMLCLIFTSFLSSSGMMKRHSYIMLHFQSKYVIYHSIILEKLRNNPYLNQCDPKIYDTNYFLRFKAPFINTH